MKVFYSIIAVGLIAVSAFVYWLLEYVAVDSSYWINIYNAQARMAMFTGFLTLGSFLLTLQTAIIQRLREAFDSEDHARKVAQLRAKGVAVRHYGSLERVGLAISTNVIMALLTSLFQMTIGFFLKSWSTALCVAFAFVTVALVIYLTIELVLAHKEWFRKIEAEKDGKPK